MLRDLKALKILTFLIVEVPGKVATERGQIEKVDAAGRIKLADGRTLPADFRHFAYGYAVTAHRSQGKTVDSVIISGDGMQKEVFYVAESRGRKSILVATSDWELLCESVGRSSARQSASELARITTVPEKVPPAAAIPVPAPEPTRTNRCAYPQNSCPQKPNELTAPNRTTEL